MEDTTKRCKDCRHAKELNDPNAGELRDCTLFYDIVCGRRPACRFFNVDVSELDNMLADRLDAFVKADKENQK